ncbi:FAD-dependent monooxygenase [Kibdelosporangium phytohabitans]|uniref:FAD-binding domain-containing protein n=1 Tax=Kibdelosporangium phytohabitans TaxID=860235 RepID=A0A0N9I5E8_9PSEU|nr:FAD-dependent monooxygenase [Kibdelosporangium phytohabitans]ALG09906.1 hypothetical protein AOZ06_26090 [Kibdelosporangium phytohabitans]MBE1468690.1 putative polyketide hydroxylase [Kibdelosporangium phytohabitans]
MDDTRVPVLIAGGGLTGLSAAVFLAWHGVPAMLVERHPDTVGLPKVRTIHPRTVELYRAVGIEDRIRATRSPLAGHDLVVHAESLAGEELKRLPPVAGEDLSGFGPCAFAPIDQDQLERILRARAGEVGTDLRFHTELMGLGEHHEGVTAVLRDHDTGHEYRVFAEYMIAADGAKSPVRTMLGIGQHGRGTLARLVNVYFNADLTEPLRGRKIMVATVCNPVVRGSVVSMDADRLWRLAIGMPPDWSGDLSGFTEERCTELVRAAVGVPDLALEIDQVATAPWEISGQVADRWRSGRVVIAGDAAHTMPPIAAFGASTGVQDVYNLAWKLALVWRRVASHELLDSYESERLPVAEETVRQVLVRYAASHGKSTGEHVDPLGVMVYGYTYPSGAFISEPGGNPVALEDPGNPSARPGTRAPHLVVERSGERISIVDLFGRSFVVLAGEAVVGRERVASYVSARTGVEVDWYRVAEDGDIRAADVRFTDRYGIGPDGIVLVRPDGFVAWRAVSVAGLENLEVRLLDVVNLLLCAQARTSVAVP